MVKRHSVVSSEKTVFSGFLHLSGNRQLSGKRRASSKISKVEKRSQILIVYNNNLKGRRKKTRSLIGQFENEN